MDADIKKLKKLTKFMQKEGLLSLKLPNIELHLSPTAVFHVEQSPQAPNSPSEDKPEPPQYTEEDALFWSSPGFFPDEVNH